MACDRAHVHSARDKGLDKRPHGHIFLEEISKQFFKETIIYDAYNENGEEGDNVYM